MRPNQIAEVNVGDKIIDVDRDRSMDVIHVEKYNDGSGVIVAVVDKDKFAVSIGTDPVPAGRHYVREILLAKRIMVHTNDKAAVHRANVEFVGANEAAYWEKV